MRNSSKALIQGLLAATSMATLSSGLAAQTASTDQNSSTPLAAAAAANPTALGEIVVTATRRSETLSKVPSSVAAFTQAQLDTQQVRQIDDIARLSPGLTFRRSASINGNNSSISIRGVAAGTGAATTAIYIDDTPIQVRLAGNTATNPYPLIFDLDRVEVLRGPQGTLFGASSEGGAVRFITPKPNYDRFSVYARSEISSIQSGGWNYEAGVAIGAPIVADKIAFHASAWFRHDGGYVDQVPQLSGNLTTRDPLNTTPIAKNINTQNSKAFKLDLGFKPTDTLTITPSIYYQDNKVHAAGTFYKTASGTPVSNTDDLAYNSPLIPRPVKDRFVLPALLVNWDLGPVSLISNSSYFDRKLDSQVDLTIVDSETFGSAKPWTTIPGQVATGNYINTQKNISQEIRLQSNGNGRLSWIIGGFYQRAKQYQFQTINDGFVNAELIARGFANGLITRYGSGLVAGDAFFLTRIHTTDEQLSGFAQVDFKLTNKLKLTAGARISQTKFNTNVVRDGPLSGGLGITNGAQKETPVTPKFGISWQVDPGTLIYASASKGFRPGGAQPRLSPTACRSDFSTLQISQTPDTYSSDSLWSYEVGAKKNVGNLVQINSSGYVVKWNNIQQSIFLGSCGGSFITNTGSVTSQGFDVSIDVHPTPDLTLGFAGSYNHTSFDQTTYTVSPTILKTQGSQLSVPPITLVLSGEYDFDVRYGVRGYLRSDYQYIASSPSAARTDFGFSAISAVVPSQSNLNLRLGARLHRMDISIFATNVLNYSNSPNAQTFTGSQIVYGTAARPRTVGLNASYRM